jgi:hypothetical protein
MQQHKRVRTLPPGDTAQIDVIYANDVIYEAYPRSARRRHLWKNVIYGELDRLI